MKLEQIKQWDVIEYSEFGKYENTHKALVLRVFTSGHIYIFDQFNESRSAVKPFQIVRVLYNTGDPFKRQENPSRLHTLSEALIKLETGEWNQAVDTHGDIIRLREESKKLAFRSMNSSDYKNVGYMRFDGSREWAEYKKPKCPLCGKPFMLQTSYKGINNEEMLSFYSCDNCMYQLRMSPSKDLALEYAERFISKFEEKGGDQ